MSHLLFLFISLNFNERGEGVKSSSYGLLTELALLVECMAPGQNCIAQHALHAWSIANSSIKTICTPKLQRLIYCC